MAPKDHATEGPAPEPGRSAGGVAVLAGLVDEIEALLALDVDGGRGEGDAGGSADGDGGAGAGDSGGAGGGGAGLDDAALHEVVVGAVQALSRLEAAVTRLVDRWDSRTVWAGDGSKSPAARLARDAGCGERRTRGLVRRARSLRTMPVTTAAYEAGGLSSDHVEVLGRANAPHRRDLFAKSEPLLVDQADRLGFDQFARMVRYWSDAADDASQDGDPEERARRQRDARHLNLSTTLDGATYLSGRLDAVDGEIVAKELQRIEQQLFEADWATARGTHGLAATADQLPRTAAQRRADALVVMARNSAACRADATPVRPLISVICDYPTLTGAVREFFNGTVLTPGQVARLLTEADIERIVFDGPSRVIDIGTRTRFFTGALRRAVEVRDRTCTHPGCGVEAEWCQVDHIVEYRDGGQTVQPNGRLLCPRHNRQRPGRTRPDDTTSNAASDLADDPDQDPSSHTTGDPTEDRPGDDQPNAP